MNEKHNIGNNSSTASLHTNSPSASDSADESYSLLTETSQKRTAWGFSKARTIIFVSLANLLLFVMTMALFCTWYFNTHMRMNPDLRRTQTFTPLMDLVDLNVHSMLINGSLYPAENYGSIAREMPNLEADALWEEWELTRVIPVTKEEIMKMGKDPSTVAKLEDDIWGLGDDAYTAILDVYHQLHCVNELRKLIYPEYYPPPKVLAGIEAVEGMHEIHLNHCVDILVQALQCSGNMNLITLHWTDHEPYPFPDMSINWQCTDFDRLTEWRLENSIEKDKFFETMMKPEGIKSVPNPDGWYKYYNPENLTNPNHHEEDNRC